MSHTLRKWLSLVALLLIITMAGATLLPDYSHAYTVHQATEEKRKQKHEIVEMRTENSKTYLKGDHTYISEQYLEPIHFKEKGIWQEIDNTIESVDSQDAMDPDFSYENKANRYRVGFAPNSRVNKLMRFQLDEASVDFGLVDAKRVQAEKKENRIAYPNVYPDTHLVYYLDNTGVKEEWILDTYHGQDKLTMTLRTQGVEAKKQKDGSIDFVDAKGNVAFTIPRPFMVDENLRYSGDVQFTIREEKNQTYLDLELDKEWLNDPERAYPVVVDPSIVVEGTSQTADTFVGSAQPNTAFGNLTYVTVGNNPDHGRSRALFQFDLQPILSNAVITSAKLSVYQTNASTQSERENLHPITQAWSPATATWNNQPTVGASISHQTVTDAGWYDFFLTGLARDWYSGKTPNHGIALRHATETNNRKSYFSSEYANDPTRKPKLTITYYIDPLGQEAFWTTAASHVNTYNGNFFLPETDVNVSGRGIPAEVTRAYNSRSTESGLFGNGWTSNLEQRIVDNGHGPLMYIDEDGTTHTFIPNGDGTYAAPPGKHLELRKLSGGTYRMEDTDQTVYRFNTSGRLTSITDSNSNRTSISYTSGNPTRITDASGRILTLSVNGDNRVTQVTDPANRTVAYTYDAAGNLQTVTKKDAAGNPVSTVTYGYDTSQRMTTVTDANGIERSITYDDDNRVQSLAQPLTVDGEVKTATTSFQYNATNGTTTVTNPKGTKTVYTHNEYGNVTQITKDPNGLNVTETFVYNDKNELISQKDANANANNSDATYRYTYDDNGNLTSVTNPLNETATTEYDENNNPVKETDPKGNTTLHEYDDASNETSSTDAMTKSSAQKHDAYGNVIEETAAMSPGVNLAKNGSFEIDRNGDNWPDDWYQWSASGTAYATWQSGGLTVDGVTLGKRSMRIVNPSEDTLIGSRYIPYDPEKTYFASGYVQIDNAQGLAGIQATGYDADGRITKRIKSKEISGTQATRLHVAVEPGAFPANTTRFRIRATVSGNNGEYTGTYRFDGLQVEEGFYGGFNLVENSGLERDDDPQDTVPDRWFMSAETEAADGVTTAEQHTGNMSGKLVGRSTKWKSYFQDIQVSGNAGAVFTVSGFSKVQNPNPNGGIYGYIIKTYQGSTEQETFTYPFNKNKSHDWEHKAAEIKTTKAFDRVRVHYEYSLQSGTAWFDTAKVIPGSITTQHEYDANGNYPTKTTDPAGRVTESGYDPVGNVTSEKKGAHTTSFAYDGADRLTQVTDAKANETRYAYDANGNKTQVINARGKETRYEYNEINQVRKSIDALGQSTTFAYDRNGNLTKWTQPNGNRVQYGYDAVDRQTSVSHNGSERYTFEYDPNGNVTKETDKSSNQSTTFAYDNDNKLTTIQEPNNQRTEYTYDQNGNVTERKLTAGSNTVTQGYAYDANDLLTHVKENSKNRAIYTYNENDQVASRKNEDGTVSLFRYNGAGDLVEQILLGTNGEVLDTFAYTYDNKGNITAIESNTGTTSYRYDSLEQLTKETRPDGTVIEYTYDATGNRLTKKVTKDGSSTTTNYTYDDADQLTAVDGTGYTYDENGNLTDDGIRTYVYDAENRLLEMKEGGNTLASFTYRADGMRKTMTTAEGTLTFHYDEDNNVTHETNESNQIVASYTYGANNELVSMTRNGQTYIYQTNYRGDVTALTDSSGNVVATYEYDAFGNLIKETGNVENPYRYAGYRYDEVTGLYYLQSRYYHPEIGRFLTRDSFEGFDENPLSANKYTYGHNNPIKNVDPDGYHPFAVLIFAAMKYVAYAALQAWLWTNIYMHWNYGLKRWPRSVYVNTFAWNFAGSIAFGPGFRLGGIVKKWLHRTGALRWFYFKAVRIGAWIATKSFSLAYSLKRRGFSWYVSARIIRWGLGKSLIRSARNMIYRMRGYRYF